MRTKILIDVDSIVGEKTGVGYFTERLLVNLADANKDKYHVTAYYFNFLGRKKPRNLPIQDNITYKEIRYLPKKVLSILHRLKFQLPIECLVGFGKFNLMIFPSFVSAPTIRKTPQMIVIHDMAFLDCPEYLQSGNLKYLQTFVPRSVRRASLIATVSEFTKSRVRHHYGISRKKPFVVLPSPYESREIQRSSMRKRIKNLTESSYLLFVGTLEPRKNINNLVLGFSMLPLSIRSKYKLVLAGGIGWEYEKVMKALDATKELANCIVTGYVTDHERDQLYKNAKAVVMVSHYEGFGMPILEAGHYKKPLVLSSINVFKEIAGKNAYYCDPDDPNNIAQAIQQALANKDPLLVRSVFSWEDNIKRLSPHISKIATKN